jgi:hypothetical protein
MFREPKATELASANVFAYLAHNLKEGVDGLTAMVSLGQYVENRHKEYTRTGDPYSFFEHNYEDAIYQELGELNDDLRKMDNGYGDFHQLIMRAQVMEKRAFNTKNPFVKDRYSEMIGFLARVKEKYHPPTPEAYGLIIQGPPGTGKTQFSTALEAMMKMRNNISQDVSIKMKYNSEQEFQNKPALPYIVEINDAFSTKEEFATARYAPLLQSLIESGGIDLNMAAISDKHNNNIRPHVVLVSCNNHAYGMSTSAADGSKLARRYRMLYIHWKRELVEAAGCNSQEAYSVYRADNQIPWNRNDVYYRFSTLKINGTTLLFNSPLEKGDILCSTIEQAVNYTVKRIETLRAKFDPKASVTNLCDICKSFHEDHEPHHHRGLVDIGEIVHQGAGYSVPVSLSVGSPKTLAIAVSAFAAVLIGVELLPRGTCVVFQVKLELLKSLTW